MFDDENYSIGIKPSKINDLSNRLVCLHHCLMQIFKNNCQLEKNSP